MRLNLGCGNRRLEGYFNVDKYPACNPDAVVDLEVLPWPWPDNSVEEVDLHHVLEHLGQRTETFLGIMGELYRVMMPNALAHITVPHPLSDGFLGDPTHVRPITPISLHLFSQARNRETIARGWPNTPLGLYLGIDLELVEVRYEVQPHWRELASDPSRKQEMERAIFERFNVVSDIKMTMRKVEH
jgi:hypothetical protein